MENYKDILENTYIVKLEELERISPDSRIAARVGNNRNSRLVYIFAKTVSDNLEIIAPLSADEITECGVSFKQFEKDYKPKYYDLSQDAIIYYP